MATSRRDQLVETAAEIFGREGFHATGIDRVLAEAGVAKMTLYKHFRSKDELIIAALRRHDETFRNWFVRALERRAAEPRARLLAIFDLLGEWFEGPDFHGCPFISAADEFKDPAHPIHAACAEHKRLLLRYLTGLAAEAGAAEPEALAQQLKLLIEGATVGAHVGGESAPARHAKAAATALIAAALD